MRTDRYGRLWDLPPAELCPTCGQPDNCGDCNHEPMTADEARQLGWVLVHDAGNSIPPGEDTRSGAYGDPS